jgi:hypothetical protein
VTGRQSLVAAVLALFAARSPFRREQPPAPPLPKPSVDPARVPRAPVRVPSPPLPPSDPPLERPPLPCIPGDGSYPLGMVAIDAGGHRWTREASLPLPTRNTMR